MKITKKALLFLMIFAFIMSLASVTSLAAIESKVVVNEDYSTSSTGLTYAANAGSYGQSKMTVKTGADGGGYAVFCPTLTGTNPGHAFVEINNPDLYVNSGDDISYLIYDMDIATETQYHKKFYFEYAATNSGGSGVFSSSIPVVKDSNGNPYISFSGETRYLESDRGAWQHLTFVLEIVRNNTSGTGSENTKLYVYMNGELIGSSTPFSKTFSYLRAMRISVGSGAEVNATDTICLDNVKVTQLGLGYGGNLSSVLSDPARSLTEFDLSVYGNDYVFPKSAAIAKIGDELFSSVGEIEEALSEGDELVLLADVLDTLEVSCGFSVYNPKGYKFSYDNGGYNVYSSGEYVLFVKDYQPHTVTWHIGGETVTQTYTEPSIITPPSYSEYSTVDGIQYKAMGFAHGEDGEIITSLGYAYGSNSEFWIVYLAPSAYTVHKNGAKTFAYDDTELDGLFLNSTDGDTIVLTKDTVACSTNNASAYKIGAKSITVDLSGNALELAETNSYDIFTVAAGGNLTLKNGTVNMLDNGRIPEGSTSIARRRLFYIDTGASGGKVTLENLTINACKMIGVVKTGEATLKNCVIDFTRDYENMIDLYSSNNLASPPTLNLIGCEISSYKTVVNTYKPSSITENISVVNIKDCNITTSERILSVETVGKVSIEGGSYKCKYLFGKENLNPAAVVEISEGVRLSFDKIDEKGKLKINYDGNLAKCNDGEYPYVVAKESAKITWNALGKVITERWAKGEMPVCPIDIPQNTREVKYELPRITEASEDMIYKLTVSPNFTLKASVNLGMNPSINVYIPEMNINNLAIDGVSFDMAELDTVLVEGLPYYKITLDSGMPKDYGKNTKISVFVDSATGQKRFDAEVSIPSYVESILTGGYDDATYELALSMLLMMAKTTDAGETITAMMEKYKTDRVLSKLHESDASIDGLSGIIGSAELVSSGAVLLRLHLDSAYSGTVSVVCSVGGADTTLTYAVSAGRCSGKSYIDIEADAVSLVDGFEISADGKSGKFDLYTATLAPTADADAIRAVYAYAKCASAYLEGKARG